MKKSYRTIVYKVKYLLFLAIFALFAFTPHSPYPKSTSFTASTQSALKPISCQTPIYDISTQSTTISAVRTQSPFKNNECLTPALRVQAATTDEPMLYARILDEDTVFYSDPGCTLAKFTLPYGYFVKILHEGENSIAVRYMDDSAEVPAREGFILAKHYYPYLDEDVEQPYPDCKFTLFDDEVIFSDNKAINPKAVLPFNSKCAFYGYWKIYSEMYYCVYSNGYIGYVRKNAFINGEVPDNPLPVKTEDEPTELTNSASDDSSLNFSANETTPYATGIDSAVKTVIVLAVSLVALSVVYLLFKPTRKNHYRSHDKDVDDLL